jgi:hypothetical protein
VSFVEILLGLIFATRTVVPSEFVWIEMVLPILWDG